MIGLILTLIVVGLLLWAAKTYIPMDPAIANIITAVVVIATIIYVLAAFGLGLPNTPVPMLHVR